MTLTPDLIGSWIFRDNIKNYFQNFIESCFYFDILLTYYTIDKVNNCVQREIPFETLLNIILARHKAKQKIMFLFSKTCNENKL